MPRASQPTVKKGTTLGTPRFDVQEATNPEGHVTGDSKTWPVSEDVGSDAGEGQVAGRRTEPPSADALAPTGGGAAGSVQVASGLTMKKRLKGPTWKKGQVSLPPVYHPPQVGEAHLTEEQKTWPLSDLVISPVSDQPPPDVQARGPNPPAPPVDPPPAGA